MANLASDLASTALKSLSSLALKEAAAAWNFKSNLLKLTNTITVIRDVLVAHENQPQRHDFEDLIERLRAAVHEADDLLDEFTTLLERKKLMMTHGRFMNEVRIFFSRENQVTTAFTVSRAIKRIRKTLDDIVRDNDQFASMLPARDPGEQSVLVKREETCSFIVDDDVIGRDDDKRKILDVLLNTRMDLIILPIIGMGGLGKTAIAQLVFNAEDVKRHFEPKIWACIGNDDLDLKFIIRKIIMAVNSSCPNDVSLEYLLSELRKMVEGKKYLLVLDDLWGENLQRLSKLQNYLKIGGKGSAVVVTTRSKDTAEGIRTVTPLELQLLSDDASWILFEKMTSTSGEQHEKDEEVVQIGKAIVKKCANLPLAIRVIGRMLRGRDKKEWRYFKDHDLAKIDIANDGGDIIPLLKLSYYRLSPQLKHCFAYCSLFPKDREMKTITLCQLWIAQGFIPSSPPPDKSLEDVAKDCFNGLLNRCFFQDIDRNEWGEIKWFNMHDLIHDLAKEVAGKEFLLVDGSGNYDDSSIEGKRHLSISDLSLMPSLSSSLQGGNHIRTFLRPWHDTIPNGWEASNLISSFQCIKVLDLADQKLDKLPDSIGKLIHIRYLDLSINNFEMLPKSITRLHNLQTLKLFNCVKLKELPCDLNKLVNLQNLDLRFCYELRYMPSGMGSLTCLQRLTTFVVGENKSARTTNHASGFGDLFLLNSLRGSLQIDINRKGTTSDSMPIRKKAGCLLNKDSLTILQISFHNLYHEPVDDSQDEELLESLQPHSHLKRLRLIGPYVGQRFPGWMSTNNLALVLPNLVEIRLYECPRCQNLPILSLLPSVRSVTLEKLSGLEYIESRSYEASASSKSEAFFPSLRHLELRGLPNVRGWWGPTAGFEADLDHCDQQVLPLPSFPRLKYLSVENCPNMTSMPLCPGVDEKLGLQNFNENLCIIKETAAASLRPSSSLTIISSAAVPNSCTSTPPSPPLKRLTIDNTYYNHLPKQCLQSVTELDICGCTDVALSKSFLQHFTEIVALRISRCPMLDLSAAHNEENDQVPWKYLGPLCRLTFSKLPKLTTLPKGLQYLTNLQELSIWSCDNLAELPEWIGRLSSSLHSLDIDDCIGLKSLPDGIKDLTSLRSISLIGCGSSLTRRCREPTGEDWPKIQHIPQRRVEDGDDWLASSRF